MNFRLFRSLRSGRSESTPAVTQPNLRVTENEPGSSALLEEAQAHFAAGHASRALAMVRAAIASGNADPRAYVLHGVILASTGRIREAAESISGIGKDADLSPTLLSDLARLHFQAGEFDAAASFAHKALAAAADFSVLGCLAASLHAREQVTEAAGIYGRLLEHDAESIDALLGFGSCLLDMRRYAEAEPPLRKAVEVDPGNAGAWIYLAEALESQRRESEALAAYERASAVESRDGEVCTAPFAFATCLANAGRLADAIAVFEAALPSNPSVNAYLFYAHTLLGAGRLPEGWWFNEFRWMTDYFIDRKPAFGRPHWIGQELRGKTLLVYSEQGLGDTIQFVRYLPAVKALGATVFFGVRPELERLLTGMPGVDRIFAIGTTVKLNYDFFVHLLTLPMLFRTDLATIPVHVPYIDVPEEVQKRWRTRLGHASELRVGLVWAGNPDHPGDSTRSVSLEALVPLGAVFGVQYFSLQKGARAVDAKSPPTGLPLVDLADGIADFVDTAAIICNLDVVVCVDTAVAHLAGALGKEVWVLIERPPEWRWLLERTDTPWYPSMRLFRQTCRGDWSDAIAEVVRAMQLRVAERGVHRDRRVQRSSNACPALPLTTPERLAPTGVRPGLCAVTETRQGILQYLPDDGDAGRSIAWYGEWLQSEVDMIEALLKPGMTVVEAGADVGLHSLHIAAVIGAQGHLIAYEADPVCRVILRENVVARRHRHVTILPVQQRRQVRSQDAPAAPFADVRALLDELQLDRLDFLKVNASAMRVLNGAGDALWRLRSLVFVSDVAATDRERIEGELHSFGYRCWRVASMLFNPNNFARRDKDIFAGRQSVCVIAIPEEAEIRGLPANWIESEIAGTGSIR